MRRLIAACGCLTTAAVLLSATAAASGHQPDNRYHLKYEISNLWLETDACRGFASTSPLLFSGSLKAHYSSWYVNLGVIEEGRVDIRVVAMDGGHTYRIHQRYEHPREYREFIYGYATTVVVRDDGARMEGWSSLGIDPLKGTPGTEGVWWIGQPTCGPPA